uniref:DDE Tnp4 domain-containing protein n=1 Tax=Oryza brachyantha TaxID=4533 RepID=J3LGS7_ORYBR
MARRVGPGSGNEIIRLPWDKFIGNTILRCDTTATHSLRPRTHTEAAPLARHGLRLELLRRGAWEEYTLNIRVGLAHEKGGGPLRSTSRVECERRLAWPMKKVADYSVPPPESSAREGHNLRNRLVGTNFDRSGETVSRYFNKCFMLLDCIGAIDGTHIRASVRKNMESSFRGRKTHATQNVMAALDFDLRFTYVLAGWEGTAHDAVVLRDALDRENGLVVPQGKFYLVDAGYGAKPGFLPPFRAVRCKPLVLNFICMNTLCADFSDTLYAEYYLHEDHFGKINRLRKVSAAGWDEEKFIITLDAEHYNDYIKDHKSDADYFNKPLVHHGEMLIIFGSTMATGKFTKDSSSVLGTEDVETENEEPKKAKTTEGEDDGLISAFSSVGDKLVAAIVKACEPDNKLPEGFDTLKNLPGLDEIHRSLYYAHLVANPHIARAFDGLPLENKLHWVGMFISEKFPGSM